MVIDSDDIHRSISDSEPKNKNMTTVEKFDFGEHAIYSPNTIYVQ